jgi:hypothetical protein
MAIEAELRRRKSNRTMEKTRIRETMLFEMYSDERNEFRDSMCLSCSQGKVGQRDCCGMCTLWMSRMR